MDIFESRRFMHNSLSFSRPLAAAGVTGPIESLSHLEPICLAENVP